MAAPARVLDRRAQSFLPVYAELFRSAPDAHGRPGYGLSGSIAIFVSVVIQLQGSPADGRRQARSEIDGAERFTPRTVGAGDLVRMYGWSYDEIQSWAQACESPHPCPHCERGHALLRIDRQIGRRNRYSLVRCQDLSDRECVPVAALQRGKRAPTGAADPARRQRPNDAAFTLFAGVDSTTGHLPAVKLDDAGTLGETPRVDEPDAGPTLGQYPRVSAADSVARSTAGQDLDDPTLAQANATGLTPPRSSHDAKLMVLRGFAALEGVSAPDDALEIIARAVTEPDQLLGALIHTIATASMEHTAISAATAQTAIDRRSERSEPSEEVRGFAAWTQDRVLELARRREPQTSIIQAAAMRDEFYTRCLDRAKGDRHAAEELLAQILTDPRICGAVGRASPKKPLALLRDGLRSGWIWEAPSGDLNAGPLARAFERLLPGDRAEVEHIFRRASAGEPLDLGRLRRHNITSRAMIRFLEQHFSTSKT